MELEDRVMAEEAHTWWWVFLATGIIWLMLSFVILRLDVTSVKTVGYLIGMMFVLATLNEAMVASASNGGWKIVHYALAVLFVGGAVWAFVNPGESVFALASILVLGLLVFLLHRGPETPSDRGVFLSRVLSTYGLTLVIAALLLFGVDRLDLFGHPWVAIKRTVLVAFPACFAATVVDHLGG